MFSTKNFVATVLLVVAVVLTAMYIVGVPAITTAGAYMTIMVIMHELVRALFDENYAGHVRNWYIRFGAIFLGILVVDVSLGYLSPTMNSEFIDLLTQGQALVGTIAILLLGHFLFRLAWKDLRVWSTRHRYQVDDVLQAVSTIFTGFVLGLLFAFHVNSALIAGIAFLFVWLMGMTLFVLIEYEEAFSSAKGMPALTVIVVVFIIVDLIVTFTCAVGKWVDTLTAIQSLFTVVMGGGLIFYFGKDAYSSHVTKRLAESDR